MSEDRAASVPLRLNQRQFTLTSADLVFQSQWYIRHGRECLTVVDRIQLTTLTNRLSEAETNGRYSTVRRSACRSVAGKDREDTLLAMLFAEP